MNNNLNTQINLPREQIDQRIDTFIDLKRDNSNISNNREFRSSGAKVTCARLDTPIIDRAIQMKTYKIDNQCGPLEDRVRNLEDFLQPPLPLPEGIIERIKALEDRALALEKAGELPYQQLSHSSSSSRGNPEKKRKLNEPLNVNVMAPDRELYSTESLDIEIETLKERLEAKLKQKKSTKT
jgi:hypothetical protein